MKVLLALAAGYLIGARAGSRDYDQLLSSVRAIRDSDEFNDFLTALRSHASQTLRELADMLERVGPESLSSNDLVDRVRQLAARVTFPFSDTRHWLHPGHSRIAAVSHDPQTVRPWRGE